MIQSGVVAYETTGLFSAIQAIVYGFIMHMADQCHLAGFAKVNLHNLLKELIGLLKGSATLVIGQVIF